MMKPSTERDYRRRIARVVEAILLEPGAHHTLESLAAVALLSPFHFHRVYRALTGESVVETVQRLRLAQAAQRLTDAAASVTAVAHDAGYNSPQAFARAFRGFTGVSPSEFKAWQKRLAAPCTGRAADAQVDAPRNNAAAPALPAVELTEIAPFDVLSLRHDGPVATIGQTFRSLMTMLRCDEKAVMDQRVGICVRDPAAKDSFSYRAAIVASPHDVPLEASDAVEPLRLEGGLYAVHRLIGPYALISPTFRALYGGWLPQSGYLRDRRPALELYRNPLVAGLQQTCVTDLMIPIRKD
ncbi:GyrI-like domain-containing protein [Paraburkholderia sp. BL25I1N1]|uniref:AraC family transcriptional regulator n=1 Tax=Paraburkholderia sp. BL25I1N1 TaxID=1938804 RepID=UPI000D05B725|nr:GyrI-like domain-containing protein [Paraburkholderia sp. BL25I1N1]